MMIQLTFSHNKHDFFVRADHIRSAERHPENLLETLVAMNLMTPQGPLVYNVLEPPAVIADMVNTMLALYNPHK